jgi:hypothetical protein
MNLAGRISIRNIAGLGLERTRLRRYVQREENANKREPRVGGCAGLRAAKKGARGG